MVLKWSKLFLSIIIKENIRFFELFEHLKWPNLKTAHRYIYRHISLSQPIKEEKFWCLLYFFRFFIFFLFSFHLTHLFHTKASLIFLWLFSIFFSLHILILKATWKEEKLGVSIYRVRNFLIYIIVCVCV